MPFGVLSPPILVGVVNNEAEGGRESTVVLYGLVVLESAGSVQVGVDEGLHGI